MSSKRIDSSTIGVTWSLSKAASSIYATLYHYDKFLDSKMFPCDLREATIINAEPNVFYTANIKANYIDGTSATTSIQVNTC